MQISLEKISSNDPKFEVAKEIRNNGQWCNSLNRNPLRSKVVLVSFISNSSLILFYNLVNNKMVVTNAVATVTMVVKD